MRKQIWWLLAIAWMGHTAVCSAASPAAENGGSSSDCPSTPTMTCWTVDQGKYNGDYAIMAGMQMTMDKYSDQSDDWQIKFQPGHVASQTPPPGVDSLHLVLVTRHQDQRRKSQTIPAPPYWDWAAGIMLGQDNYYGGIGNVDNVPTLAVLVLYGTTAPRNFCLVLVKLDEATHSTGGNSKTPPPVCLARQGGVIHGHENLRPLRQADPRIKPWPRLPSVE